MVRQAIDFLMVALSAIGTGGLLWLALGIVAACLRHERTRGVWQMGLALLVVTLLGNGVIKPAVHRPRPAPTPAALALTPEWPTSWSFPSGHASSSFAAAYALGRVWPAARVPLWALAIGISVSRLYLGVHYPTDVLAGALFGLAVAWFAVGRTRWSAGETRRRSPAVRTPA